MSGVIGGTSFDDYIISRYSSHDYYMRKSTLINGHSNKVPVGNLDTTGTGNTPLQVFDVVQGKKYRFRLINLAAVSCRYQVAIDNHKITVIATDGYPIRPVTEVDIVTLFNGERYDIVFQANQNVGNYWLKAIPIGECNVDPDNANGIAIIRYSGAPISDPTEPADQFVPTLTSPVNVNKVYPKKTEAWRDGMVNAITAAELTSFNDMPEDLKGTPDITLYIAMDQLLNDPLYDNPRLYPYTLETPYVYGTAMFSNIFLHLSQLPSTTSPL